MYKPNGIVKFDGKNCSRIYARLLTVAREDGIHFTLDSGYRSIAQQWRLWRHYKRFGKPKAAFPGTSTHNKRGFKQGLDISALDHGAQRFKNWAATHGIIFDYTVPGEPWHLNAREDYTHKIEQLWESHNHHDRPRR